MTNEDELAIEALGALAGSAADDIADNGFSAHVLKTIHQRRRRKHIIIGATGSIGSAIAGAYTTAMVGAMPAMAASSDAAIPFLTAITPEAIATTGLAGVAAVVAWIVPSRI